jgi:hypothetical protein
MCKGNQKAGQSFVSSHRILSIVLGRKGTQPRSGRQIFSSFSNETRKGHATQLEEEQDPGGHSTSTSVLFLHLEANIKHKLVDGRIGTKAIDGQS